MSLKYDDALKIITSPRKFKIDLGLERISRLSELFDNPEKNFKIIHVAGTNGKGSVCATGANILKCAGYKTGLYTSPHLVKYTERIKINGEDISEEDFSSYIEKICKVAEENDINLTEFEILTLVAFLYFSDCKVDAAFVETGLGGRYDATNIVKQPVLSVITSVSLDHTDRLGDTVEKIAYEKAGIIKKNVPVVVSKENSGYEVIKSVAEQSGSNVLIPNRVERFISNGKNYLISDGKKYEFALAGEYQKHNAELLFESVKYLNTAGFNIGEDAVIDGLKTVNHNARMQYIKEKNMIIDGAHNPSGAFELKKALDSSFKGQKRVFIYGTINTKDYVGISKILFEKGDEIYYREFNHPGCVSYEEYKSKTGLNIKKAENLESITTRNGLKIVTGSLYMIGEIYNFLT